MHEAGANLTYIVGTQREAMLVQYLRQIDKVAYVP